MADSLTLEQVRTARDKWVRDLRDNLAVKKTEIAECDERGKLLRQQRDEISEELRRTEPRKPRKQAVAEKPVRAKKAPAGPTPASGTEAAENAPASQDGAAGEEAAG